MSQLKLNDYLIEKFILEAPEFPGYKGSNLVNEKFSQSVSLFRRKNNVDNFAVRLIVELKPINKKMKKPHVNFLASVVGIFVRTDKKKSVKHLAKSVAPNLLYSLILEQASSMFKKTILKNVRLPKKL